MADTDSIEEVWEEIPGFDGAYAASSLGRIRSRWERCSVSRAGSNHAIGEQWSVLKPFSTKDGYIRIRLSVPGASATKKLVHRLVYETFKGSIPEGLSVRHLDKNRSNNSPANLFLGSRQEDALARQSLDRKICTNCRKELPATAEYFVTRNRRNKTGLAENCKKCSSKKSCEWAVKNKDRVKERQRRWVNDNKERHRQWQKEWNEKNPEKRSQYLKTYRAKGGKEKVAAYIKTPPGLLSRHKNQAIQRGIEFSLTVNDFASLLNSECFYCGDRLDTVRLDRKDNSLGYVLENVVPCCKACNYAKRCMTVDEYLEKCRKVASKRAGGEPSL